MRLDRIFTAALIVSLACGGARAAGAPGGRTFSPRERVKEKRVFLLKRGQSAIEIGVAFIIPGSDTVTVDGAPLKRGDGYRINPLRGSLVLVKPAAGGEKLSVWFSRYPLPFPPILVSHVAEPGEAPLLEAALPHAPLPKEGRPGEAYQLRLSGSKTVGVSVGSNKDLGIDQSLKVTMVGKVAKDLEVNAYLSDDNLPVQPEGNTAELKYLDKVYMQVKAKHSQVQLGDFTSGLDWSRFSSFRRELRGIESEVAFADETVFAGGGVAKGRFKTASFRGREGVQGPYELLPPRRFNAVIILPGTEMVYFNGRLLKRGSENDYTIDYNRGSVTFTERVPVTDDSEIVIDYEMGEDNYERTTLVAGWTSARFGDAVRFRTFLFQESDDKGRPVFGSISASDRAVLEAAGDDPAKALASGIEKVEAGKGDYALVPADSLLPAHFQYVGSGGDYLLDFLEVGAGAGDYRTDGFTSRGEVKYRFYGAGKGDFQIGRRLPLPESKRLVALGATAGKGAFYLDAEGDVSIHDKNLYSTTADRDNVGQAMRLEGGIKDLPIPTAKLLLSGEFSSLDDRFTAPDKPRESYFYRDWGLENVPLTGRENIGGARFGLKGDRPWNVAGSYQYLSRGAALSARKTDIGADVGAMDWRGLMLKTFLSSAGSGRERRFVQGSGVFSFWHLAPRLTLESERYEAVAQASPDTGRYYRQGVLALSAVNVGAYRGGVSLTRRETDMLDTTLVRWYHARVNDELGFDGGYTRGGRIVELVATHRRSRDELSGATSWNDLARLRGRNSWENAGVTADVDYRIGSSEERTRQQAVIFVGANQGDYDKEGREVGQKRGDYMLVYLPGADTTRVHTVELNTQLSAGGGVRGISGERGSQSLWGRLRNNVSLDHFFSVLEESRTGDLLGLYTLKPSLLQRNDLTVYGINKLREECTLFGSSSTFKLRLTYSREDEEDNRSEGASIENFTRQFQVRAESAPSRSVAVTWEGSAGLRVRDAAGLLEERYRVGTISGSQVLNYRLNPSTRLSFELGVERRTDAVSAARQTSYIATPSVNSSIGQQFNAAAFLRFTYTDAPAEGAKPLFFLERGMREDWSVTGQYRFSRNVSFGLTYTGRHERNYEGEVTTVHDLKMESRAYF